MVSWWFLVALVTAADQRGDMALALPEAIRSDGLPLAIVTILEVRLRRREREES